MEINVAFVSDENYFDHMFVAIESIIKNTKNQIRVYILDMGIEENSSQSILNKYRKIENIQLEFIKVDNKDLMGYQIKTHVSSAAYSKIYLPKLVNVDKIIYLDCDLVFNSDITELWTEFEDNVCMKAVWNPFYNYDNTVLGISNDSKTFNSGVMLLNLNLMRKKGISLKLKKFLDENHDKTKLHDQAAFNAVFKNDWKELNEEWNVQVNMLQSHYKDLNLSKESYRKLYLHPKIVHFTSNSKPWQFRNNHPYKSLYIKYYENTLGNISYDDKNLKSFCQKLRETFRFKYYYLSNLK